ncbi:MAG: hypothetical protein V1740_04385 [Candidatus Woesearchaeota archaeon]
MKKIYLLLAMILVIGAFSALSVSASWVKTGWTDGKYQYKVEPRMADEVQVVRECPGFKAAHYKKTAECPEEDDYETVYYKKSKTCPQEEDDEVVYWKKNKDCPQSERFKTIHYSTKADCDDNPGPKTYYYKKSNSCPEDGYKVWHWKKEPCCDGWIPKY